MISGSLFFLALFFKVSIKILFGRCLLLIITLILRRRLAWIPIMTFRILFSHQGRQLDIPNLCFYILAFIIVQDQTCSFWLSQRSIPLPRVDVHTLYRIFLIYIKIWFKSKGFKIKFIIYNSSQINPVQRHSLSSQ